MSKYTTGEVAKLCGVSVRTVQYYDSRGILSPSELSEGGRRLYSDGDLGKMKIICFLREVGLSLGSIGELLSESKPENVISILLDEQKKILSKEIDERQTQLDKLNELSREIKKLDSFSVESIGDVANVMENKKNLRRVRRNILIVGIIADIIEVSTIILWVARGIWLPFAIGMPIVVALCVWVSVYYFKKVAYICPECHTVFKPGAKEAFFASHTPTTRKLTCKNCGHKGLCVETYYKET